MESLVTNSAIKGLEKFSIEKAKEIEENCRRNEIYRETGRTVKGSTQFDCPLVRRNPNFDIRACRECNLQNISTPFTLCKEIIGKLKEYAGDFSGKSIIVFNMEFIEVLVYDFNVKEEQITFLTDCKHKKVNVNIQYSKVEVVVECFSDFLTGSSVMSKRQFDCVVMNPPYQAKTKGGNGQRDLWPEFVEKGIELCKDGGYCCFIHPNKWRRTEHKLWNKLSNKQIKYLEIHNKQDGHKVFGATTRYDWYVLQNTPCTSESIVIDENGGKHSMNLSKLPCLPNYLFEEFRSLMAGENEKTLDVIYSTSYFDVRKPNMSKEKHGDFKYPCVYGMYQDGSISEFYSSEKFDHFVPKVILGIGEKLYPFIDIKGEYGMTQNAFGIKVSSMAEAERIKKAIESDKFKEIIKATKWSNFQTDWRMFKYLKKDFWKDFI